MSAGTVAVDPRMKARRIAVIRAQGRRRLRVIAVVSGIALATAAAWGVSRTPLLDVDRITITGTDPANRAEILKSSNVSVGLPMLFLDVDEVQRSVASLPWVRSAQVWRDWPATVRIAVEPRVPAAVVPASEGRTALIDANGYAIGWGSESTAVPHVSVPFSGQLGDIHTAADGPLAVVTAMPEDLRAWVSTVTLETDRDEMGLTLVGGATVVLGEPVLVDDKISALRALLATADLQCVTIIDVTMPDIATVTRHRPC
ncbi:MAG: FtsQ-type POTRA domain-containing protein [Acidimicrobiia bacterium]|nr:FtsQ-type POTRA domain-containing protein [Acidimicrobiia bacterium]